LRRIREREWGGLLQGFLKQCPRFAWILLLLLPNTKGQGRGGDATVNFVQRVVVVVLDRVVGWFGGVSNKSEITRDRYCDGCMHEAFLEFWVCLILVQTMLGRGGSKGWDWL
jgi:hypothetical protein